LTSVVKLSMTTSPEYLIDLRAATMGFQSSESLPGVPRSVRLD
jgi:hypothetical protein